MFCFFAGTFWRNLVGWVSQKSDAKDKRLTIVGVES
jgi:hypothetical protein